MRRAALFLLLLAIARPAAAQQPFTVGPVTAAPGTVAAGTIEIAARAGDTGTRSPSPSSTAPLRDRSSR